MIIDLTPFLVLAHFVIPAENRVYRPLPPKAHGPPLLAPIPILEGWAQYAPQYPVGKYSKPPQACDITQVNILKRHGARFPTNGASKKILSALDKLQSATSYTHPNLKFLKDFTYDLGTEALVPFGALQSHIGGQSAFTRYHDLVDHNNIPFVRASGSERVVDSATNWTAGFSFASQRQFNPVLSVIMSEDPTSNNTLDDSGCPLAGDSNDHVDPWVNLYATPIADRLNSQALGMKANLTPVDVNNLISLCPFESVAKQRLSLFCKIFEPEDFANFEWGTDLDKYYGTGYGQPVGGRVQGVGYVNELIARLTASPVRDNTQTNRTLTSSPVTFPLNRSIYADFTHDNEMVAIFSAIGLLNEKHEALNNTRRDPNTEWDTSKIVPFSSEMVIERLSCKSQGMGEEYVRIFINDALQPLSFCGGDKDGLCRLLEFLDSQSYARNDGEGDFEKCFSV